MWFKYIFFSLFLSVCFIKPSASQESVSKTDSARIYRNIEAFSSKRKFTKFLYGLVFKPVTSNTTKQTIKAKKKYKKQLQRPYSKVEGKIIRNIHIVTLDPFGYTASDTTVAPQNFLFKAGNALHFKTLRVTIRNLLLFHKNEPFDSLLVKESERLIRSQRYVHQVYMYAVPAKKNSDSVDVFVRVKDLWSIDPQAEIVASHSKIDLTEKNFLGTGHEFRNIYKLNHNTRLDAFNTTYSVANIKNTYINAQFHYETDEFRNYSTHVNVERPFFSAYSKLAGGAYFAQHFQSSSMVDFDSVLFQQNYKFNVQDYWLGTARQVFKGNTENARSTNLIMGSRFINVRYLEQPSDKYDTLHLYSNEDFYLASIALTTRKYVQERFIFNYGLTEDVPVGQVYGLTAGYQIRNNIGRMYLGTRVSMGNFNDWGYVSFNVEFGTFFRSGSIEQGVLGVGLNYFTGLVEIGRWKFRQFVKPQYTVGINRHSYESININNENGIRGFISSSLKGTQKAVLTLQTQFYSPWNILGFRFGPYFVCSLGILGNSTSGFKGNQIYSQLGLGILVRNEFFIFNVLQISVAFYPINPDVGNNLFKVNPGKTTDFGFLDFDFGKPATVAYR